MADLVAVKVVDDVAIYMDPETGQFVAAPGCTCRSKVAPPPRHRHTYPCKAKTVTRKALKDLERDIQKGETVPAPIEAIMVNNWGGPQKVRVISVEPSTQYRIPRYRGESGNLYSGGADVRVYSPEALQKLQEGHAVLVAAREAYEALEKDYDLVPQLTREKCRELQRAQQAKETES